MEVEKIREWLDKLIANREELNSLINFSNDICLLGSPQNDFYLYHESFCIIADILGLKVNISPKLSSDYGMYTRKSFVYKGWVFKCVESENAGTD